MTMQNSDRSSQPSDTQSDLFGGLTEAIRHNPIPAAAIGMGLAWLFFGGGRLSAVGGALASGGSAGYGAARSAATSVSDAVAHAGSAATGAMASAVQTAGDRLNLSGLQNSTPQEEDNSVQGGNQRFIGAGVETLSDAFARQPLLLGAIGLALGAGLAAALPQLKIENEWLGETSDSLKQQANALVSQGLEQATSLKDSVLREAQAQGLTPNAVAEALKTNAKKVADVVGSVGTPKA